MCTHMQVPGQRRPLGVLLCAPPYSFEIGSLTERSLLSHGSLFVCFVVIQILFVLFLSRLATSKPQQSFSLCSPPSAMGLQAHTHGCWGSKRRSSCLYRELCYPLSHLPSSPVWAFKEHNGIDYFWKDMHTS